MKHKRNLTFAIVGLAVGLFSGFKFANANYRGEIKANRDRTAAQVVREGGQSGPGMSQVQAAIEKARANPQDHDAQIQAAELFIDIRRPDGALEFLNRALTIKPNDATTLAALGEVYYLQRKFDESIKYTRQALKAQPGLPIATFYLMASLVETRQNLDEAGRLLSELERLRPGDRALAQVRQALESEGLSTSRDKGKTVLEHGPEEPKRGQP
jgi:tetratricopeptide (TPR) repeat protein